MNCVQNALFPLYFVITLMKEETRNKLTEENTKLLGFYVLQCKNFLLKLV